MSCDDEEKRRIRKKLSTQILVSDKTSNTTPKLSSALRCDKSSQAKTVFSKWFSWNPAKPRPTSEYVDKKFGEPFNKVAPELRAIGGLGEIKCVVKQKQQPLINRPTQVKKLCRLTNFPLTEQLRPVACPRKTKLSALAAAERVKFAENLPSKHASTRRGKSETKASFNHQNPFNLDLKALSEYQRQKHNAEETERRRNYQIIRRTMETKALKTEGVERILQDERNGKFQLPAFFKVIESNEDVREERSTETLPSGCKVVSTSDKPRNREIILRHYQHKEEKLRKRLRMKAVDDEKLAQEAERNEEEKRENFVFRLAVESFPASECDSDERHAMKELPPTYEKFDYPLNESELSKFKRQLQEKSLDEIKREKLLAISIDDADESDGKEIGLPCGQKMGNRVILRGFHDRICKEPRGETNYYHLRETEEATCLTHEQWFHAMANDPEMLRRPPRGKRVSTLKVELEPNSDKIFFFVESKVAEKSTALVSPVRQQIHKLNEKLKVRLNQRVADKSKSYMSFIDNKNNQHEKRYQRMKFMGIPVQQSSSSPTPTELRTIVDKISQTSLISQMMPVSEFINETPAKRKHSNAKLPQDVKLMPQIPDFDYIAEEENCGRLDVDKFVPFTRAQPRGTNEKNLRIDKSLPWIQDEVNSTKVKLAEKSRDGKTFSEWNIADVKLERKLDGNPSAKEKSYKEIIDKKLRNHKILDIDVDKSNKGNDKSCVDDEIQSVGESNSSLSSIGTYFTNDSGSCLMALDKKIPKSEMNLEKKFQNRSLVTTQLTAPEEVEPYIIPALGQLSYMKELCKPKDKFHTFRTRSCANIRERIKVESDAYNKELIGNKKCKSVSKLATDIDEYYQEEIYNERSRTCFKFKPKTEMVKLRDLVRKKMDIYWMKERMIREHVSFLKQEASIRELDSQFDEYSNFLDDYKDKSYRHYLRMMQELNDHYLQTDELSKRRDALETLVEPLKMRIFNYGNDFVQLTILQNFQYLLMPTEWRNKYDFMHRAQDGSLENFRDSINKRETVNLWNRENMTAYSIRDFILDVHVTSNRQRMVTFESGEALLATIQELYTKSYRVLRHFHLEAHTLAETEKEFATLEETNGKCIDDLTYTLKAFEKKRIFMENRSTIVREIAESTIVGKPLSKAFKKLRNLQGHCNFLFQNVALKNGDSSLTKSYKTVEKIAEVETKVLRLLDALDLVPKSISIPIEDEIRKELKQKLRVAEKAYSIELGVKHRVEQLKRLLAKPPKKQKREGKLPMSVMPKKSTKPEDSKPMLTSIEADYIRAFTEFGGESDVKFDESVKQMIERVKNESIPLYLDHLLDSLGFSTSENVEQKFDSIVLDEAENFKFKDNVLQRVRDHVKLWRKIRDKIKRENIRRTPYLYQ